jgi:hypothetical protein
LYFDKLLKESNRLCTAFCRAIANYKRRALLCVAAFRGIGKSRSEHSGKCRRKSRVESKDDYIGLRCKNKVEAKFRAEARAEVRVEVRPLVRAEVKPVLRAEVVSVVRALARAKVRTLWTHKSKYWSKQRWE